MSIGLYDADMMKYINVPFNLEIMKLSSYYKRRGEIVILSPTFSPERNKKFIYRKDYDDGTFSDFTQYNNIEYGGLAFSQNKYIPLDLEIEKSKPDTNIYRKQERFFVGTNDPQKKKEFNDMIEAEHLRLSLDGINIWKDYPSQFKNLDKTRNIFFHDINLNNIKGAPEEIKKILQYTKQDKKGVKIGVKFPIITKTDEDLIRWIGFTPNSNLFFWEHHGVIGDEAFLKFLENFRTSAKYKQFDYYITKNSSSENDFIKNYLLKIFHQVIISRSYRVFFSLKYDDNFFFDKNWEDVIDLFNFYQHSMQNIKIEGYIRKIAKDTMADFAEKSVEFPPSGYHGEKFMPRSKMKKVFQFIKKMSPELYNEFFTCSFESLGGLL